MSPSNTLFIGTQICMETEELLSPLGIIMLPGDLVADIVLMPMELFRRAYYVIDPPLNELIGNNDLVGLEKKLKRGANPNVFSRRSRLGYIYPLIYAKEKNNLDAVKILVKYGAKISPRFFDRCYPDQLPIFQYVFDNGLADSIDFEKTNKGVVRKWMWILDYISSQEKLDAFASCIALILEHGASPNDLDYEGMDSKMTALDLLKKPGRSNLDRTGLERILLSHGALTYQELEQSE